jgi:hypothetical protein
MKSKIFDRITHGIGKTVGVFVNEVATIKGNIRSGYEKNRIKKCIWCKNTFPLSELRGRVTDKYPMCDYCLEGLGAAEGSIHASEKYKEYESIIIDAMLRDAAADSISYSAAINSFIYEANLATNRLFPDNK